MRGENAAGNLVVPAALMRSTPRQVKLNASGVATVIASVALVVGCLWGAFAIERRFTDSRRHITLFAVEAVRTEAEVVRLQPRGEDGRRTRVHYRYAVDDREYSGSRTVGQGEAAHLSIGSRVNVWYLASEPEASWLYGSAPERQPIWPAFLVVGASAVALVGPLFFLRRQWRLLAHGRPAAAVVRKVEKKRSDKGSYWRVYYEWTLLSGARRRGRYSHAKKTPPEVGTRIPILYDRDQPSLHGRYPLSLVAIG